MSPGANQDLCGCCEIFEMDPWPVCRDCREWCHDEDECQVQRQRCPKCLHWWINHGIAGEDGYACTDYVYIAGDFCGCTFADGNPSHAPDRDKLPERPPSTTVSSEHF